MASAIDLHTTMLAGARELLHRHAREVPQRDDLCGAFCGALALHAAGVKDADGQPLDQDAVALAAGTVVSAASVASSLPHGERSRRDYRLSIPVVEDPDVCGTTAAGLRDAVAALSGERLEAIPYSGPFTPATLDGLFDLAAALERPVTLIANLATRHLWGSHPQADQLLGYLLAGELDGPAPDWDVGHFACVVGRVRGTGASLYILADTYPALGHQGVHLQPQERLAAALERRGMPAGGMFVVAPREDAPDLRAGARALGLTEGPWDNGTVASAPAR